MVEPIKMEQEQRSPERIESKHRPAFAGWPMIVAWAGMLLFAFHASTHMVGAGDTWVALACGRHFINHGVDTVEPFSAHSHKPGPTEEEIQNWPRWARWLTEKVGLETVKYWHPTGWINQNWLTHVLFYWLSHKSPFADAQQRSYNTLVYWKFAIYILAVLCVYYIGRLLKVNPALSAVLACFAMFVGRSFFDIRPAGFSNLLVGVFFLILVLATYRNTLYMWLMVPLVVLWCNLHGGYIYAFIMLASFFIIHFLILLPERWTLSLHSILAWLGLYGFTYRFLSHDPFTPIPPGSDQLFLLILILAAASIVITSAKQIKPAALYGYHLVGSLILFFALWGRFFPNNIFRYSQTVQEYIRDSRISFVVLFLGLLGLGVVVARFKDRLVSINRRGLFHTACVGIVAFVAMIIFNPFHLTNLTHTFVISVSKHAEQWRTVNEWHPAFEWQNPVGTSFPFLVLFMLCIGLGFFWLLSRFFRPKLLKGSRGQLELEAQRFSKLSKVFGFTLAVYCYWVAFISLSFIGLDAGSFFVCTLFAAVILLSIYRSIHFIYLQVPLVLLAMSAAGPKHGYTGMYIYPFVLLPAYVITHIIASLFSEKPRFKALNIVFVAATAVVSLVLMVVIFDPFKFKQPLWHVEQFFELRRIWVPRYEGSYKVHYGNLFPVLYGINAALIFIWVFLPELRSLFARLGGKAPSELDEQDYQLPKADLALMLIAALTVYMAIRSRRFIPIAAITACPILGMFIDQMSRTISAGRCFHGLWSFGKSQQSRVGRFAVPTMPRAVEFFLAAAGTVVVAGLGIYWTLKFKTVYLDPWPTDPKLTSVFMRMTASDAKPFYALDFIRENHLKGNMFNYWTEGGFIAYGQEPDPNTGKTPLRLFMDGRAQAAYDRKTYDIWMNIMAGGRITYELERAAKLRGRKLSSSDYRKIGQWIDKQLTKPENNVWVVLMPAGEFHKPFVKALEHNPNWQLAFLNNKQKLFVDVRTPQGRKLLEGIWTGKTYYPNDFSLNLIKAHRRLTYGRTAAEHKEGLDYALAALKLHPSAAAMQKLLQCTRYAELRGKAIEECKKYFDEFESNHQQWSRLDGYHHRLFAAYMAADYLASVSDARGDKKQAEKYRAASRRLRKESGQIIETKRW